MSTLIEENTRAFQPVASGVPMQPMLALPMVNDWDFAGTDTQYSTHGLHTYVAAMIPDLARKLLDQYVPEKGSVLDPFCGGGAVLVEAVRSGRVAIGRDINDLAVTISTAKTNQIAASTIESVSQSIVAEARQYEGPNLEFPSAAFVEFWFKDYMMKPLTGLRLAIDDLEPGSVKTLMKSIFSATVRSVSLTYRNEVRLRRMSIEDQAKFNPDVFDVFKKTAILACKRVPELPKNARADVKKEDVRNLDFRDKSFDTIICSPPYGDERNGVNYTQFSKNMLHWLGYSREDLKSSKSLSLGWGKSQRTEPPSMTLRQSVEKIRDNRVAVREAIAFYADYFDALKEMKRVVRDRIIIVIGNRVLHKTVLDNPQITIDLFEQIGVSLENVHYRSLPTKRLPKMREFGAAIDREAILVFKK